MRQETEDERGRDLVGGVGDADVKVGEFCLHKIADDDLEPTLLGPGCIVFVRSVQYAKFVDEGRTCPELVL